jgi:hypothetical protein
LRGSIQGIRGSAHVSSKIPLSERHSAVTGAARLLGSALHRIGYVNDTVAMLDRAEQLSGGQVAPMASGM